MHKNIQYWDQHIVFNHVNNHLQKLIHIFKLLHITNLVYIDIGFNVGKVFDILAQHFNVTCYGFEPAQPLFDYCIEKYQDNNHLQLFNMAISNYHGLLPFNTHSLDEQLAEDEIRYFNLGGCKIQENIFTTEVQSCKISDMMKSSILPKDIIYIKSDTETKDTHILEDILTIIDQLPHLKIIETEINYFTLNEYSFNEYQALLNQFINKGFNYYSMFTKKNNIDSEDRGDVFLLHASIEHHYEFFVV